MQNVYSVLGIKEDEILPFRGEKLYNLLIDAKFCIWITLYRRSC